MNRIYVFSATGNSLKIAKELASKIKDTEIVSIPSIMSNKDWRIEGETVGFVFPCFYGSMPQIINEFIRKAESIQGDYFFSIATAGRSTGLSNDKLSECLENRGIKLNYSRSLAMVSNYMNGWYYSMIQPSTEQIEGILDQAEKKAEEYVSEILQKKNSLEKGSKANYRIPRTISPTRYVKDTRPWDSEFSVNNECTGCGLCSQVCPVKNIEMKAGNPSFAHNCQRCMACIQYCPRQSFSIKGKRMNKERYTHPQIAVKEMVDFQKGKSIKY